MWTSIFMMIVLFAGLYYGSIAWAEVGWLTPYMMALTGLYVVGRTAYAGANPISPHLNAPIAGAKQAAKIIYSIASPVKKRTRDDIINDINNLIGLDSAKQELNRLVKMVEYTQRLKKTGQKVKMPMMHAQFIGPPGAGKTTFARLYGELARSYDIIKGEGQLLEKNGGDFIGQYLGESRQKTKELCEHAIKGNILFIDEAYALASDGGHNSSYQKEAVEQLLIYLENYRDSFICILAGYEKDMQRLFLTNEGFPSRVPNTFHFPSYNYDQLYQIFMLELKMREFTLAQGCETAVMSALEIIKQREGSAFANARSVRTLIERIIACLATRVSNEHNYPDELLKVILEADIEAAVARN